MCVSVCVCFLPASLGNSARHKCPTWSLPVSVRLGLHIWLQLLSEPREILTSVWFPLLFISELTAQFLTQAVPSYSFPPFTVIFH